MTGHIYFRHGDDSGSNAIPVDVHDKPARKTKPAGKQRSR